MNICVMSNKKSLGEMAATEGAKLIRSAITEKGFANIIVATGASQLEMLEALVAEPSIDWSVITGFHLDEYVGLPISHPASFRKYLKERFVSQVPLAGFHYVSGEGDPEEECRRVGDIISKHEIDVAFVGIGENGHLAFNDPPADFETEQPYLVVELDEACRRQQLGEGWFPTLEDVPLSAISMSVQQIMKSKAIICTVPDKRKAEAVRNALEGEINPDVPASILQKHPKTSLFLDQLSASLLHEFA